MREIKFRAWDVEKQEMVTRGYEYQVRVLHSDIGVDGWDGAINEQTDKEASLFVLMQYTGLKDKNGVEIYEGDIVRIDGYQWYGLSSPLDVVELDEFRLWLRNESFGYEGENLVSPDGTEVIGNIYENPELLKGVA